MASPRLQRILATLCPSLFFTLPGTDDPVFVFSVAGLVASVFVFMFPGCLLAYLYNAVAYYHPRVIIFWVPPSVVRAMNVLPLFLADRSFVGTYAAALLAGWPIAAWYQENVMVEKVLRFKVALECTWVSRVTAFLELMLKRAIEKTETLLDMVSGSRTRLKEELKRQEQELEEFRRRSIEQHELTIAKHNDEMQRLRLELTNSHRAVEQQQQEAYDREREEAKAARKSQFKALMLSHRREEHQAVVFAREKAHLKARLASVNKNLEATTAARRTDATRFAQQWANYEAQYSALQGSLDFATAEHRYHIEQCERDHDRVQDRLEQQENSLDEARRTHTTQLASRQRHHELEVSTLRAKNDLLKDRLISVSTTRDAIMASYKAHIEHTNKRLSAHEIQYTALEGSLAFATAEHRIHVEHCDRERTQRESHVKELTVELADERSSRAELHAEHDGLKNRHTMVSEGFADAEKKLKLTEREFYLEKQRHHSTVAAYQAGQQVSDALIDRLTAAPPKGQSPARAHSLLRQVLIGQATAVQVKSIKCEEPHYTEQLSHTLPPSTLFDESWTLPHPDSLEGSTRVDVEGSVPDFDNIAITATSTPARPREDHQDVDSDTLAISQSDSGASDMSLSSMVDPAQRHWCPGSDGELSALLSRSMESMSTSSSRSLSSLGLESASSDMSLASIVERSREEHLAISPSGLTGSDMSLASVVEERHRPDLELSLLLSGSASLASSSLSSLDLSLTSTSDMSLASMIDRSPQCARTLPGLTEDHSDLDFEPSLPPPPETSFSQSDLDGSFGPLSADCSEASISLGLPSPLKTPLRSVIDLEPSLPPPPEDTLEASSSLFSLPDEFSVAGSDARSSESIAQESSLPLEASPSQDRIAHSFRLDLGNESFGADVIAKSTPVFTRWVNMQRRSNAPESPTRDRILDQSRSEIMLRVSQLFTEGWGFDVDDSEVVDVDKTRKCGE